MWDLTQRIWEMAKIFGKWLRYMRHGLNMASMCGGQLKYLRNGFNMLEMT